MVSAGSNKTRNSSFSLNDISSNAANWMESASDAFGRMNAASDAMNRSQSQNMSDQMAQSQNQSNNFMQSFVDQRQSPFLQNMYAQAQQFANPMASQQAAMQAQQMTMPQLQAAQGNIAALTDPTSQIAAQRQSLRSGLGSLFREEMMPAIQQNAMASGGFGGGRQGVAEGVAAGQIADSYTQGLGDITARANQSATAAASLLPALSQQITSAQMAPSMAGLDPLQRLAGILGGPTVLQQSEGGSFGTSSSRGQSRGMSEGFGRNRSRQQNVSGSTSRSRSEGQSRSSGRSEGGSSGKSSGWKFGFGGF